MKAAWGQGPAVGMKRWPRERDGKHEDRTPWPAGRQAERGRQQDDSVLSGLSSGRIMTPLTGRVRLRETKVQRKKTIHCSLSIYYPMWPHLFTCPLL